MDTAPYSVEVKQEAEAAGGTVGASYPHPRFSTSVTTGQGRPYNQSWPGKGVGLGNNRAPIPTCGISVTRGGPSITMVSSGMADQRPVSAQVADTMMGTAEASAQPISSASLESTQERAHLLLPSEEGSFQQSEDSDMASDDEDTGPGLGVGTAPAMEQRTKPARKGKEKRKVGRPIAYKGDPNAPELTDQERRRIKRRIANRESARRVRHKRQEILEEMQAKMEQLHAQNCELARRAQEAEGQKQQLCSQMAVLEGKYKQTAEVNGQMQQEISALRQSLQVKMSALEAELDKRASEVDGSSSPSAFSMQALQPVADCSASRTMSGVQRHFAPTEGGAGLDVKAPLEWFPSLNLDDMPVRAESWDLLNSLLREETAPTMSGEAVC